MASSARFSTPPFGSQPGEPLTPDSGLRSRSATRPGNGNRSPDGDASPTSTTVSSPSVSRIFDRPPYRGVASQPSSGMGTPARKVIIRADPTLFTCFDPVDKDLYDLWAPKIAHCSAAETAATQRSILMPTRSNPVRSA